MVILMLFWARIVEAQIEVIFFLSPTCKICQFYSLEMRDLYQEYSPQRIEFKAFSPKGFVTDSALVAFVQNYQLPFEVLKDDVMHRQLGATLTPEVFVIYRDQTVYHGRIDDSFVRVGKRRTLTKNRELRAALDALLNGRTIEIDHAPAVGCIIEK